MKQINIIDNLKEPREITLFKCMTYLEQVLYLFNNKQNKLISGETIKTINNHNILGSGNINIEGGGSGDFEELTNRPSYNGTVMNGSTNIPEVPTKTSDLINDIGFIDSSYHDNTKQNINDNSLDTDNKTVVGGINEVNSLAKLANKAKGYVNYQTLITELNSASKTDYNVGQSFLIQTLNVPDLWVISVENTSQIYTYTTDADFITATEQSGGVQVGYYKLGQLETLKQDLTNYITKTDYATQNDAGVIKITNSYGTQLASDKKLRASIVDYSDYSSLHNNAFIGKATLENVITGKGLVSDTYHDNTKQNNLVSGTNIKTINNNSLLGSGNINTVNTYSGNTEPTSNIGNNGDIYFLIS